MSEQSSPFIARESDIAHLQNTWQQAKTGMPSVLRLQSSFGGGRRAAMSLFLKDVQTSTEEAIVWRVTCLDQENGLQWLVRMYGSLVALLTADVLRRGKIEMILNAQLPNQPQRVQRWYQSFISTLKEAKTDKEKGQVKLQLPKDNPLLGLVEIVNAVSRKIPVVLELQNPQAVNSLTLAMFVEAIAEEAREQSAKLLVVMFDQPPTDTTRAMYPLPLIDLYDRRSEYKSYVIEPWGAEETQRYLDGRSLTSNADRIADIAGGRPGFIAEIVDILNDSDQLGDDLTDVTLASLAPVQPDENELEVPTEEPKEGERKYAVAADAARIAYFAALLGPAFPSSLVADMGGFARDSVDDMFDALDDLFEEVQFAEDMGTWIYRFKRGSWQEGLLQQNDNDEGHQLARQVGVFMERFLVPRGYSFISKTARVYAEHGALAQAARMRSVGLSNDANDVWGLCYDFSRYFDEITWPEALLRTIYMNLLDHLIANGAIPAAERVHTEITQWATEKDDREFTAWLLYAGSRLDTRRQDLFRARDRAKDALKLYEALDNKVRVAEIYNHMAAIELQDGNPNAALDNVKQALEFGQVQGPKGEPVAVPGVLANAEYIRGLVKRRENKPIDAIEHFRKANEIAGSVGLAALALDSGLSFGEALLASGQVKQARDVLQQVTQIAVQLRNGARERNANELLAQAEGALKNFEAATKAAARTLQLSQAMKFEHALPVDLYNLGFFHFASEKPTEALTFFKQAEERIGALGEQHPVIKELYYFMGLAHLKANNLDDAEASLKSALTAAERAKDMRKVVSSIDNLAGIEHKRGNTEKSKSMLTDALAVAKKAGMRDERKALRKKLESL
ncbi:MAG: tetratricopeptide repeat protein [Proteobacteria bacterium]|nr:tetratricopeptide repeat protein [Pseudomonadota bacterium]